MTPAQELKEKMRLYEMYSTAVLAGYASIDGEWSIYAMIKEVDKVTKQMIEHHFVYSEECMYVDDE
jgi:hypothetical protein